MKKNFTYAIVSVFIWSTTAAIVKLLLGGIPNLEAMAISSYLAAAFLLIVNLVSGKIKLLSAYSLRDYAVMGGLGFVGLFLYTALYYYGIGELTSQEACILNYLWPIMLVVFSCIILKEKLTLMKSVAMLCSFAGIVILSLGNGELSEGNTLLGIASCIGAAASYGLFSVLNKRTSYDQGVSMMIMWFVTGICSTALGLMTEEWTAVVGTEWLGMAWLGIFINAVAYLLWALALKGTDNTAKIANLAYLTPFLSIIVSAVLIKEKPEMTALIALVFIIGGILLQNIRIPKEK